MGTISEKLTYLNTTKSKLKDSINALGGEIDNNTTFREYAEELDTIYSNLPKVTGEGSNISLSPTLKGKLELEYKGDTSQETLTGKNLFNIEDLAEDSYGVITNKTSNSFTITRTNARFTSTVYFPYTIPAGTTLKLSGTVINNTLVQGVSMQFGTSISYATQQTIELNGSAITLSSDMTCFRLYLANSEAEGNKGTVTNLQLEKGSTATSYEPYCGGIQAPNPNYEIPIQVVTGEQEVEVCNKNLFTSTIELGSLASGNRIDSTTIYRSANYIEVLPNTDYIFSINGTANRVAISFYDSNETWINRDSSAQGTLSSNGKFTTPSNCRYIMVRSYTDDFNLWATNKLQLEYGSTATTYEPYTSQTYTLHLGDLELYEDGFISREDNKWYINNSYEKYSGKLSYPSTCYNATYQRIDAYIPDNKPAYGNVTPAKCNKFINNANASVNSINPNTTFVVRPRKC